MKGHERFLVAPCSGKPGNEYRIAGDRVQFRIIESGSAGAWRTLDPGDILMHLTLDTCVGRWLTAHSRKAAMRGHERMAA